MFKLTPAAEAILSDVRAQSGKPADYGVRFFASGGGTEPAKLAFDFVAMPNPGDMVDDKSDPTTIVAPEVEQMVGDAVVDVQSVGDETSLVLRRPRAEDDLA